MTQIKTINENGELVWNDGVPPIINTISNNDGNIVEVTFRDTQGKLCFGKWTLYSKVVSRYDKRGNEIEKAYFDANGLPCEIAWQGHKVLYKYDNKGDVKEETFWGKDGNPFLTEYGAKIVYLNDENGNTVEDAHYGIDGQLFGGKDGVAIQRYKYNKDGNIIEMTYYDIQDQLCLCGAGYAKSTSLYDENGRNWIEWAFYDSDGLPCLRNVDEVAKWCMKYDDRGNRIEYAYFDTKGNRCLSSWTYSAIERTLYDDRGKAIEESFWGCNEEPCYNKKGYHIKRIEYNEAGNILKQSFFGIDNQLCLNSDSIAQSIYTYDDRGNLIQETYWGIDGKPRLCKYGYAKYTAYKDVGYEVIAPSVSGSFGAKEELPNLLCKAMFTAARNECYNVHFAFCNEARYNISKNYWTYSTIYESFPFDNVVYIVRIRGEKNVKEICNYNWRYHESSLTSVDYTTWYTVAVIDYLLFHTSASRSYNYFSHGSSWLEILGTLKKDGKDYLYRDVLADYLRGYNGTLYSSDYQSSRSEFKKPTLPSY